MIIYFCIYSVGTRKTRSSKQTIDSSKTKLGDCRVKFWWRDQGKSSTLKRERKALVCMYLHKLWRSYTEEEGGTNFEVLMHEDMQDLWCGEMLKSEIVFFFTVIFPFPLHFCDHLVTVSA